MKKLIELLIITISCFGLSTTLLAQGKSNFSPLIAVTKEAKAKLKKVRKVGIFLNCNDPLLKRVVEDAFAIQLTNAGFININREVLEKSVGEQIAKKKKEKAEEALNALDIGKAVNADCVLTGTVLIESGEQQSLLVKISSFQMVDVASGETLISILFEHEKGKSFSEIAKRFVDLLKENMI